MVATIKVPTLVVSDVTQNVAHTDSVIPTD